MSFSEDVLAIDCAREIDSIVEKIRTIVLSTFHRKGAVVAVSGGIDSSVCAALCSRALGKDRVLALSLPERDSSADSRDLARLLAARLDITLVTEDVTGILAAAGCYRRQAEAIAMVFPEFEDGWRFKLTIPSILDAERLNVTRLTIQRPSGEFSTSRMPPQAYLQLIGATNFKQRTRRMIEYYHADRLSYAVCGTPNRLEYDQGFFVKGGDGLADFKPIAHLYKTQVYELAEALGIPKQISRRTPTTDTFSLAQTQEEFYFSLPYHAMDLCLYARNHNIPAADVAAVTELSADQVERVFRDIDAKRRATLPLHLPGLLSFQVEEIATQVWSTVQQV